MTAPPPKTQTSLPTFAAGAVTVGREPTPVWSPASAPVITSRPGSRGLRGRSALFWYGSAAGLVLIVGLIVLLVMLLGGQLGSGHGPFSGRAGSPSDVRPPLARLCPPPTDFGDQSAAPVPTPPPGPRTVDNDAGISYTAYGAPWTPWNTVWRLGTLEVPYGAGQHFITETYPGGDYEASILSAAVPATVNDSTAIDLECTGHQVAADVRASYYPQPNTRDLMREERTTIAGRPAWVTKFRLHFTEPGLRATSELVGLALIDVGRPTAAVIYISIPDTHAQWDRVVDEVLASILPT